MIKTNKKSIQYLSTLSSLPLGKGWLWAFILTLSLHAQDNTQNWVKQIAYKTQTTTPISTPTAAQANVSVTYLDGLGRPIQQVASKMANNGNDIVQPIVYDSFGRQSKSFMPYVATTSTMQYTDFSTADVNALVAASYPQFTSQNFFSETQFDNSPLNRVMKQAAPGSNWAMSSGKEVKYDYQANTLLGDKVRQFSVTGLLGTITETTNYEDNKLYKTILYDENTSPQTAKSGIEEFKNLKGQVVLKRTYAIDNGNTTATAHDTYNVYDEIDNLRCVISPKATDATTLTPQVIDNLCYQYKYDYRNRLIEKKEPGKQWQFIVYDEINRIVATGPATNPFGGLDTDTGWLRTFYDNYNRVCYTAWTPQASITTTSRATLQASFTGAAINNVSKTTTGTIDGKAVFYSYTTIAGLKLLTVNYYDNYNFPDAPTVFSTTIPNQTIYYNNSSQMPRGLPTGSWTRALTSTSLSGETAYILYDYRARPIETKNINYLGGFTRTQTKLDFVGKIEYNLTSHSRSTQTAVVTTKDVYTYSDQDRMLVHTNQILPSGVIEILTNNTYNNIGQLLNKKVGGTIAQSLQKIDYNYNIRGWLTNINDVGGDNVLNPNPLIKSGDPTDLFAFKINYNTVQNETNYTGTALYNGNIAETYWRTNSDNQLRKYGYSYDNMNRLRNAVYQRPGTSVPVTNMYNESMSYDQNGNIQTLQRNGDFDAQSMPIQIDNLVYSYKLDSQNNTTNQLARVNDATNSNASLGFKNGTNLDDDYIYDANGNMVQDLNKTVKITTTTAALTKIVYNHLNLPTEIFYTTTKKINYIYNALGQKLQKIVTYGTATNLETTDYVSGYQYLKSVPLLQTVPTLQFFPTAEGYVNFDAGVYKYVYNYLDHLGNVRVSYTANTAGLAIMMEENHYYPYGLKHTNYNTTVMKFRGGTVVASQENGYKYKFNGCELQKELDLNLYDMDMRDYDPATARWTGIDPVTHFSESTYCFAANNPVFYNDPSGADYALDWANNQVYNILYVGSSSNWGQSEGDKPNPYDKGVGSAWGDGGLLPSTFYGASAVSFLQGFGRTFVKGPAGTVDSNGNVVVYSGHWVQNSSGGLGITGAQTLGAGLATDSLIVAASYGALQFIGTDLLILEPTDLFVPKYVAYAVVAIVATAIIYTSVEHFAKQKSSESVYNTEAEHISNARASTKATHETGQARKGRDKGGEKGDARRTRYK